MQWASYAVMKSALVAEQFVGHPCGGTPTDYEFNLRAIGCPSIPEKVECAEEARLRGVKPWQLVDKDEKSVFIR